MQIVINGEPRRVDATTLAGVLIELGYGEARLATALDGEFIPAARRAGCALRDGSAVEILAPRQGG